MARGSSSATDPTARGLARATRGWALALACLAAACGRDRPAFDPAVWRMPGGRAAGPEPPSELDALDAGEIDAPPRGAASDRADRLERLGAMARRALTPGGHLWHTEESSALAEAASSRRGVVVDFSAAWCRDCATLSNEALTAPEVVLELERGFVPLRLDVSEPTPRARAELEHYGVTALPAVLILDGDGRELDRVTDVVSGPALAERLRAVGERLERGAR
ncbi:MAG: thioredoxin family protein [Polyangiaceae bacterium]|nr:thioredoxin family protein [Polyangiaceae bacterium]